MYLGYRMQKYKCLKRVNKIRFYLLYLFLFAIQIKANSQINTDAFIYKISSSHTSFPDTGRLNGHIYDSVFYSFEEHYNDSSVMIIVPKNFKSGKKIDFIFWFHGWNNNIDSAAVRYQLIKQFLASKCNAILVFAETAKDSPDSYGGKLEQQNAFKYLVNDVLTKLKRENQIAKNCIAGNIVLAGHSGAYRVIAYILKNGGMPVKEVDLFDALYSETDKFLSWIEEDTAHRFIHWDTNTGGGTDEETANMIKLLQAINISFYITEEDAVLPQQIFSNKIIFIHSKREHNEIINNPNNFQLLLDCNHFLSKF